MKSRILVVDDEESIREFLEIMLKKEGYEITLAEDGQKAKDLLAKVKILPQPDEAAVNRLKGFRIDNVPSGSVIEEAGIKNGDIICSIQGRQLSSLQEAWSMFNKVQDQNHVEIVLLRDNQPVTLNYEIEK